MDRDGWMHKQWQGGWVDRDGWMNGQGWRHSAAAEAIQDVHGVKHGRMTDACTDDRMMGSTITVDRDWRMNEFPKRCLCKQNKGILQAYQAGT